MAKKINILTALLLLFSAIQCQEKKINMKNLPEYNVMISHPDNEYRIEFVSDRIKTLEGVAAHLPYGGTSGEWGDSHSVWTEQYGTPIGTDIVYYAPYENTYYHLDVDFPMEKMKDLVSRAYASDYIDMDPHPVLQEYIISKKTIRYASYNNPYDSFSDLVFGFAPKGMVVVWLGYGGAMVMELGRYQAKPISEDEKLKKWFSSKYVVSREEVLKDYFTPDASPEQWDNYRNRYNWRPVFSPDNTQIRIFWSNIDYYNAERERLLRPFILNPKISERAVPREIQILYKTADKKMYEALIFFDWQTTEDALKKLNATPANIEMKIADDNNSIGVFLNGQPLKTDSIRIYSTDIGFPEIE